jgi:hypothetical protein
MDRPFAGDGRVMKHNRPGKVPRRNKKWAAIPQRGWSPSVKFSDYLVGRNHRRVSLLVFMKAAKRWGVKNAELPVIAIRTSSMLTQKRREFSPRVEGGRRET